MPPQVSELIADLRHRLTPSASTVVELDLTRPVVEHFPDHPVARLANRNRSTMLDVVRALDRAARDDKVVGLFVTVGDPVLALGHTQELRDAITAFAATGKPTLAWAESFSEFGPATLPYYLATACDRILLQPSGAVGLTGIGSETTFLTGALARAGVQAQVEQRHEYKNAANVFTRTEFTDAHRESMESVTGSVFDQIVDGIATRRNLEPDQVRRLVDQGPHQAQAALDAGLVDGLAYRDQAWEQAKGEKGELLFASKYAKKHRPRRLRRRKRVALVFGVGGITRGSSDFDPRLGGVTMGADTVAAALRAAADDDHVVSVVLRIDSPGGSYVASDTIWRAATLLRDQGRPLVVSMANAAASGGYFVAAAADRVLAQPGTLTGSIGVYAGKPVASELLERVGLTWETVRHGNRATMFSLREPFSSDELAHLDRWLDAVYDDFLDKVTRGRPIDRERVGEVARGRVWTGQQALERGLVDELGGLTRAITVAAELGGIDTDGDIPLRVLPRVHPLEALGLVTPDSSEDATAAAGAGPSLAASALSGTRLGRFLGLVAPQLPLAPRGVVEMPPLHLR